MSRQKRRLKGWDGRFDRFTLLMGDYVEYENPLHGKLFTVGVRWIFGSDTTIKIRGCVFNKCQAYADSGGIHVLKVFINVNIESCFFVQCRSVSMSGAFDIYPDDFKIKNICIYECLSTDGRHAFALTSRSDFPGKCSMSDISIISCQDNSLNVPLYQTKVGETVYDGWNISFCGPLADFGMENRLYSDGLFTKAIQSNNIGSNLVCFARMGVQCPYEFDDLVAVNNSETRDSNYCLSRRLDGTFHECYFITNDFTSFSTKYFDTGSIFFSQCHFYQNNFYVWRLEDDVCDAELILSEKFSKKIHQNNIDLLISYCMSTSPLNQRVDLPITTRRTLPSTKTPELITIGRANLMELSQLIKSQNRGPKDQKEYEPVPVERLTKTKSPYRTPKAHPGVIIKGRFAEYDAFMNLSP